MFSPLEQFNILPIFQIPFVFSNASLILLIGLIYIYIYSCIKIKFIPTRYQQIFESIFNITIEAEEEIGSLDDMLLASVILLYIFL